MRTSQVEYIYPTRSIVVDNNRQASSFLNKSTAIQVIYENGNGWVSLICGTVKRSERDTMNPDYTIVEEGPQEEASRRSKTLFFFERDSRRAAGWMENALGRSVDTLIERPRQHSRVHLSQVWIRIKLEVTTKCSHHSCFSARSIPTLPNGRRKQRAIENHQDTAGIFLNTSFILLAHVIRQ